MARSFLSIDVRGSDELQAAATALGLLDKSVNSEVGTYLKSEMGPSWQPAVSANARRTLDTLVLADTATMAASGMTAQLKSAAKGGKLSGGFPITQAKPYGYGTIEFGTNREKVKTYTQRTKHGTRNVTRHTARQMPPRVSKGRVVYPAAAEFVPRVASLMVQTIIRTFYECFPD